MSVPADGRAVVVDASSPDSRRCAALADVAEHEARALRIRLGDLPAPALLRRGPDPRLDAAVRSVVDADVVVFVTPVHRATYSGLLKVFADVLPRGALDGTAVVVAATGRNPSHRTPVARSLRDLVESLGGRVVAPTLVLTEGDDVDGDRVGTALRAALGHAGLFARD
jgi:FMN reductase